MRYLLDVNVLIALVDPAHVAHDLTQSWFESIGHRSWATCPLTQNGLIRILGNPRYPNSPGAPAEVAELLRQLVALPGHEFWPDDISVVDPHHVDPRRIRTMNQVTDTYLLALAAAHGGQLATLDRRLSPAAVLKGKSALHLVG